MKINFSDTFINVNINDDSYRYRAIKGEHALTLHFSLAQHVEIPVGAWAEFEGERYELEQPSNFKKNSTRNFEYTLIMESVAAKAKKYKFRNPVDGRLVFSLTATPREHLQMFVDNMNARDSGWIIGECIEAPERLISYNHAFCIDALSQQADEFKTEYEFIGKKVSLRKLEYNKDNPLPLSYGRGNGFRPGVGRSNFGDSKPVEVLFVQGGEDNIDPSKYGNKSLLLPRNASLRYDGTHFEKELGFNNAIARSYITDTDGLSIRRADKALQTKEEDSLDCSHIYPKRVGTISTVEIVNAAKNFYDIIDNSIPADLDYNAYLMAGETMTVIFQSGMLAGKEFEVKYYHEAKSGKAARRFEIVPQDIDGQTMPNDTFKPVVGDSYAVFHIALPNAYVCDNTSKSGASWDMFRESVKYFYDNEEQKFSFTGELDGIWAKQDWNNIGGRIRLGGYVLFSDAQFQTEGVAIRIVGIKDYINNPHSPEIELSNETVSNSFISQLNKIEETEVVVDDQYRKALQFTKRRFRDSLETIEMLRDAMLDNFTSSINPIAVQTMAALIGDESLQFRFVNNKTNPVTVAHDVAYNNTTRVLTVPAGIIQHMTLDIDTISSSHAANEYRFWDMPAFTTPALDDNKRYYLYAKVSKAGDTGEFYISEKAIAMESVSGYYHLWMGVLNSSFDGERSYASLYGYTEVLPGRITTDKIVSSDGKTYFNLSLGEIGGKINFKDGLVSGIIGIGNDDSINSGMSGDGSTDSSVRIWVGEIAENRTKAPFRVIHDGSMYASKGNIGGWSITNTGIISEELSQDKPTGGTPRKSRTSLNADGTIGGNLLKVNVKSGQVSCDLWDDPVLEWTPRYLKMHARVSVPFEPTSAIIQGGSGMEVLYGKDETNNLIIEPTTSTTYYDLPTGLDQYNGVTLRIYNPATRASSWKAANAFLRYKLKSTDTAYTPFLGKYTGTELSLPIGKMVVLTGVREQVDGGSFGQDNLKWYVEVTA